MSFKFGFRIKTLKKEIFPIPQVKNLETSQQPAQLDPIEQPSNNQRIVQTKTKPHRFGQFAKRPQGSHSRAGPNLSDDHGPPAKRFPACVSNSKTQAPR